MRLDSAWAIYDHLSVELCQQPADSNPSKRRASALYELLLQEAEASAGGKDPKRFDQLISRLVDDASLQDNEPTAHELQMDRWRVRTTLAMVVALFLIILAAILYHGQSSGQAATGFVSLFSGLAGIALGWLFGSGAVSVRGRAPRARQSRQRTPPSS